MPYALVPLGVAAVCLWLGRRLRTLVLILAYLSIEGALKLISNDNAVVHVGIDLIVVSLAAWWLAEAVVQRRARLPDLPWIRVVAVFVVWVLALVFHPLSAGLFVSVASFKIHLTMIPLFLITALLLKTREDVTHLLVALTAIALVPFAAALLEYALGPSSVLDLSPHYWAQISYFHEWRPFGTGNVPGSAAVYSMLVVPTAIPLLRAPGLARWARVLGAVAIAGAAGALAVSGVRALVVGAVLAILVMGAVLMARGRGRAAVTLLVVVVLLAGGYVTVTTVLEPISREAVLTDPHSLELWRNQDVTARIRTLTRLGTYATARVGTLGRIWERVTHYPFGAGLGRTGPTGGNLQARLKATPESAEIQGDVGWSDSYFADMISETGIPGLLMIMTVLFGFMIGAARLAGRAADPLLADVGAGIAGVLFAIFVMSWGGQPLMTNPITAYFWMFGGVYAACRRLARSPEADAGDASIPAPLEPAGG